VDWGADLQNEVQNAEVPYAGQHVCREHHETCLAVLPGEDGALPFRTLPPLDEKPAHSAVLVVLVPDSDSGAPLHGVPGVEGPTENWVGGGAEGDGEAEEPVEDPGPPCRREMQPNSTRLAHRHGCRKESAGLGDAGSEASEWELREGREREEESEEEAEELGAELGAGEELPLFLPTPALMAPADED